LNSFDDTIRAIIDTHLNKWIKAGINSKPGAVEPDMADPRQIQQKNGEPGFRSPAEYLVRRSLTFRKSPCQPMALLSRIDDL